MTDRSEPKPDAANTAAPSGTDLLSSDQQHIMLAREQQHIATGRGKRLGACAETAPWCGIGLSGGGIRSASLALGVMQVLAENDLIRRFDYISSVSGGGYLGASLQWWWSREPRDDPRDPHAARFGLGPTDFPYASEAPPPDNDCRAPARPTPHAPPDPEPAAHETPLDRARRNLAFLRAHGSYLTAGDGMSAWSMLAVLLRTIVISLLIWIPLLTLAFTIVTVFNHHVIDPLARATELWSPIGDSWAAWSSTNKPCTDSDFACHLRYPAFYAVLMYLFYLICFLFVCAAVVFALHSRDPQASERSHHAARIVVTLLAALGLYLVSSQYHDLDGTVRLALIAGVVLLIMGTTTTIVDMLTPPTLRPSYFLRRSLERFMGALFVPTLVILAVATVPIIPQYLASPTGPKAIATYGPVGGVVVLLGGVISALYGYYTFLRNIVPGTVGKIAATAGALLYLYGTLILAYVASAAAFFFLLDTRSVSSEFNPLTFVAIFGSILLAAFLGWRANINLVGLHRFYRDRLMEAFMPTDASVTAMKARYSAVADTMTVTRFKDSSLPDPENNDFVPRPYPLINTNVILIRDEDQKVRRRGGDNFIVSPLFIGSTVTGWQPTDEYLARNGALTFATAMAASGAAANARAGYIGTGITMNPFVSAVMSLLNVRLGLWVGNPSSRSRTIKAVPNFFNPGLWAGIFGRAHNRHSRFLELTDGGHFENLGLYELVRRRLAVILIVDGEADPAISLRSLVSARGRIEQDFGATLSLFDGLGPERLLMQPEKDYPAGVRYAQAPFLVGEIIYEDGSIGTLIYVKSTLIKSMDFATRGYLASNPEFPHQSTVDQFFDPDQFEAYRRLGHQAGTRVIDDLDLVTTIHKPTEIVARYRGGRAGRR
ncbi:MAG: patatin-like phospholipase family protein [Rhodoplanes sp.]|uniref:patatin-like phospholipase family protein n=1 Tax=Rhodoplanes sp. TaxID=1968906 RepID=UPI0017FCE7A4|nr:patatin-like phospholipase family protein [Rhodoplanes sp.]NVO15763.1 patatin-like phospholipase family protein [Rhodoplanes sp.]